ncbi:MAG: M10 family metallopeptidase C-terminal domain-containing protein, partial [Nitrospira sp.]
AANNLFGLSGNDTLIGGLGNDTLDGGAGADTMNGGFGNDLLTGGAGKDILTGGGGFDTFCYNAAIESPPGGLNRDVITDFNGLGALVGDRIDLSKLDANVLIVGNQAFTYIGGAAFTAAGQLRYVGGVLQGSTDADTAAEFEIQLVGAPALFVSAGHPGSDILL